MRTLGPYLLFGVLLGALVNGLFLPLAGCGGGGGSTDITAGCAAEDGGAVVLVSGVYRFEGPEPPWLLRGTITMDQSGNTVYVLGSTYDNAPQDRSLSGQATLVGNRLDIVLTPTNGDLDYVANVTFLFSDGGNAFCVAFSDTNGDAGPIGAYHGTWDAPVPP